MCITGGTSGIGKATVERCVQMGAQVFFTGRNKKAGEALVQDLQNTYDTSAMFIQQDVTSEEDTKKMVQDIVDQYDRIDGVFANA